MKKLVKHKKFIIVVIVVIIILSMLVMCIPNLTSLTGSSTKSSTKQSLALSYIKQAEGIDISPIEDKIFENNREKLIYADEISQEKLFPKLIDLRTAIIGDARAYGFSAFGFMNSSNVFADANWTINKIPDILSQLKTLNPRNVVVSAGLSELSPALNESEFEVNNKEYIELLSYYLELIKGTLPDANIYLTSVVPVLDFVIDKSPGYAIIPSRNEAVKKMCAANGYTYIDMKSTAAANSNLFASDGINLLEDFYPIWGRVILNAVTEKEGGGSVDAMSDDQVWATLEKLGVVISGDSRGAEFSAFGFYPLYLNFSGYSKTIYNIPEIYDRVASAKPRILLLCYGVNDLGLYGGFGVEKYMSDFHGFINKLKELSPNTIIYVNSIPPSLASEYERAPNWALAYPWNEYNEAYCIEHGINYINTTEICDAHQDLYRGDGVHFKPSFYPIWARTILREILKHEH